MIRASSAPAAAWPAPQPGHSPASRTLLETSHPGIFAAGDVRHGSTARVASAVGEGAMAVKFVHAYLTEFEETEE